MTNIFESRLSIIILSIIWGLGLSTLLQMSCNNENKCHVIEYRGPPSELNNKIWNYGNNNCYKLKPYFVPCKK
jgi:hypothetical protein